MNQSIEEVKTLAVVNSRIGEDASVCLVRHLLPGTKEGLWPGESRSGCLMSVAGDAAGEPCCIDFIDFCTCVRESNWKPATLCEAFLFSLSSRTD